MRVLSFGLLGLALAIAPCHDAVAQDWPNRPVTLVVPFPAGAAVDTLARAVAHTLSEDFGKQFIVENRAGAGGNLGGAGSRQGGCRRPYVAVRDTGADRAQQVHV